MGLVTVLPYLVSDGRGRCCAHGGPSAGALTSKVRRRAGGPGAGSRLFLTIHLEKLRGKLGGDRKDLQIDSSNSLLKAASQFFFLLCIGKEISAMTTCHGVCLK